MEEKITARLYRDIHTDSYWLNCGHGTNLNITAEINAAKEAGASVERKRIMAELAVLEMKNK